MGGEFYLRVEKSAGGQVLGILEGQLGGPAAWKVIKWLEGLEEVPEGIVLDLGSILTVDWLGMRILMDGIQTLPPSKRCISLRWPSKGLQDLCGGRNQS